MGQDLAAAHLLAHWRFAVGTVHMHQIVLHVENEVDGFHESLSKEKGKWEKFVVCDFSRTTCRR
ncbi:hypothetical protein D3C85_1878160 [compost metagenome]